MRHAAAHGVAMLASDDRGTVSRGHDVEGQLGRWGAVTHMDAYYDPKVLIEHGFYTCVDADGAIEYFTQSAAKGEVR
jgi:hypothetical protein